MNTLSGEADLPGDMIDPEIMGALQGNKRQDDIAGHNQIEGGRHGDKKPEKERKARNPRIKAAQGNAGGNGQDQQAQGDDGFAKYILFEADDDDEEGKEEDLHAGVEQLEEPPVRTRFALPCTEKRPATRIAGCPDRSRVAGYASLKGRRRKTQRATEGRGEPYRSFRNTRREMANTAATTRINPTTADRIYARMVPAPASPPSPK